MLDLAKLNSYHVTDDMLHYFDDVETVTEEERKFLWIERFVLTMEAGTTIVEKWSGETNISRMSIHRPKHCLFL